MSIEAIQKKFDKYSIEISKTIAQMRCVTERVIKLDRLYLAWDRAIRSGNVEELNRTRDEYLSFRDDRQSIEECGMDYDEHVKAINSAGGLIHEPTTPI